MPIYHVSDVLSFGSQESCNPAVHSKFSIVHACKEPCHRQAVGYKDRSLPSTHSNYLAVEKNGHLYLNIIDPPVPLFKLESFQIFFDFVDRAIQTSPVLIHCNQGESRAPSLTLLYMAKRLDLLSNESYQSARSAFEKLFPYKPGKGIASFLEQNWQKIG